MNIYYNYDRQFRSDQFTQPAKDALLIRFKESPVWDLTLLSQDAIPIDLSGSTAFRAAVDVDYNANTQPLIRVLDADIDQTAKRNGRLSFMVDSNTVAFAEKIANKEKLSAYFELWGYDTAGTPNLYVFFKVQLSNVIDPDGGDLPEEVPSDYMTVTQVQSIFRAANEHQFTSLPGGQESDFHTEQTVSDTHFRYRNPAAQTEWSPWIKLPEATNPHVGDNGNWFVGSEDTGVNAQGPQGLQGEPGPQGIQGIQGEQGLQGEKGDTGNNGADGVTPHIGENNNWFLGDTDTGVSAVGFFSNGVPPFLFTNSDLSNGILTKTFAELGIDSSMPVSVNIISGDGVIMDGDVRLAMIWEDTGLKVDLSQFGSISGTWKLVFAGGTNGTGGSGSGNGYTRSVLSQNTTVQSGYWYICTASGLTLTLPAGSTGDYIRFSTNYLAENVVIKPADGETIDGDSEGFTLDKASGTVEMLWTGSEWTVIEAK